MVTIKSIFFKSLKIGSLEDDFKALFDELYDRLVYFATKLVNREEDAEDIVQDAFVQLWNRMNSLENHQNVYKQYLYSTIRNSCLNHLRHTKVNDKYIAYTLAHDVDIEHGIVEDIISAEVIAELQKAINELPDHFKLISELSYYEGKKNQEVADQLGISVNTLKKQKQRLINTLRVKISSIILFLLLVI